MIIDEDDYLEHYGILRRSGRYPWGSGGEDSNTHKDFLGYVQGLRDQGLSETEIAKGLDISTTDLRAAKSIAKNQKKAADISMAQRLKENGWSNVKIGERMGMPESTIRALLAPGAKDRSDTLTSTADMLREQVGKHGYIDVGTGVERYLHISRENLNTAIAILRDEDYEVHSVQVQQLGTNNKTIIKVLAPPGTQYVDIKTNMDKIHSIAASSMDNGRSFTPDDGPPLSISSKRVAVRYAEQGGAEADGVIYVRPGIDDVSLGGNRYAQVRVKVDDSHFLKGMAMYKDDLPPGVDLQFNTNKSDTGNKLDAMKPLKADSDLPFGAVVRPLKKRDADGKEYTASVMNIVNDEGDWEKWSKSLSSQMLSKQSPSLAKAQLDMTHESKKNELDGILGLTNPVVKQTLLDKFADGADSAAVHLKAAALPGQKTHVILPVSSVKPTEVYAPNYNNGDRVVLVRFPHGGTFEIPELIVNNRNKEAKTLLGTDTRNAIGINAKVAQRLSGADFDGDTVLVIPNNHNRVKSTSPLEGLKNFDPQHEYPNPEGMEFKGNKQQLMGDISNLITDMTIKGASNDELARAVRHSMVVIDAEKHNLNYKLSAQNNGIAALKEKYQGGKNRGASTIVSRKKSEIPVAERKTSYSVDPRTGEKIFRETGASYEKDGKTIFRESKVSKLAEAKDANALSSGTPIEKLYADHSNRLKALANEARKAAVHTKTTPASPSAKAAYRNEVASLNAKLNVALKNAPLERQAQVLANAVVSQKRKASPNMESSELKKIKGQQLAIARIRTGARKQRIDITDSEWDAIQAGAISPSKLKDILNNTDLDRVKELATPRSSEVLTNAKASRAREMLASGYTQAEVASAIGVSVSTLQRNVREG